MNDLDDRRRDTDEEQKILGNEPVRCVVKGCNAILATVLQQMEHREGHEAEKLGEPLDDGDDTRPRLLRIPLAILLSLVALSCYAHDGHRNLAVTTWDYIAGDQGQMRCLTRGGLCQSTLFTSPTRALYTRSDGLGFVYERDSKRVAVVSDMQAGVWERVFTGSVTSTTPGRYDPSYMPVTANLPIVPASTFVETRVTLAGTRTFQFQGFFVHGVDPTTCAVGGSWGQIITSSWFFILDSFDFGGDLGVQQNVLVVETLSGYPAGSIDPTHAMRLERYFFIKGFGMAREEGFEDYPCRANNTAATCTGRFDQPSPGAATWCYLDPSTITIKDLCVR
jgi:hypothetical protein